jgi:hypothetical protein
MKNVWWVVAIAILMAGTAFAQVYDPVGVHIKENVAISPILAKKVQDGSSSQCKVRIEVSAPRWCHKRIRIWGGSGPCYMDSAFVLSASTEPLTGEINSPPAGIYSVWVNVCFNYGENSSVIVREFYNDSLVCDDTLRTTDWYNCPQDYLNGFSTPYYSDFYFDLASHEILSGNSSEIDASGNFHGDCNVRWFPTDPLTLTITSGSQYVSFHDTVTNMSVGSVVTTTGNSIGRYVLVADGVPADSFNTWAVVQAQSDGLTKTDSVSIFPSVDHFYVYTDQDTIAHSDSTAIYVQAQTKSNQNMGVLPNEP